MSAFGRTDDQGKFRLTSYSSNDGAPAGKHMITIAKPEITSASTKEPEVTDAAYDPDKVAKAAPVAPPKSAIPAKYSDPKSTDLFAVVTADNNNAEINLELKD